MKFAITALILIAAVSCTAINKVIHKADTKTDNYKSTSNLTRKNTDSVTAGASKLIEAKTTDSDYTKQTIVKEYYTDEFDLGNEEKIQGDTNQLNQLPIASNQFNQSGKPTNIIKYRETIITERGQVNKNELKTQATAQVARTQTQANEKKVDVQEAKSHSTTNDINKTARRILSGFAIFIVVIFLILYIYSRLEKTSIWQILKSVIKL